MVAAHNSLWIGTENGIVVSFPFSSPTVVAEEAGWEVRNGQMGLSILSVCICRLVQSIHTYVAAVLCALGKCVAHNKGAVTCMQSYTISWQAYVYVYVAVSDILVAATMATFIECTSHLMSHPYPTSSFSSGDEGGRSEQAKARAP